jgi:dTDP-4-amino-4,6-dideoxygalactose transaminase
VNIPILRPKLPEFHKLEGYLRQLDNTRVYSNFGPLTKLLEKRFAEHLNANPDNIATCVNATLALQGAIQLVNGELKSDVWTLPVYTFAATAHAVINARRNLSFFDIDETFHLSKEVAASHCNVLHVLPFGDEFPGEHYKNFSGNLIIDAAASFDAVENFAHETKDYFVVLVVSLHPTKLPAGAEGALVYSNSAEFIKEFRKWTVFGFDDSRKSLFFGTNAKMNEYSAAVANASLDEWQEKKSIVRKLMDKARTISLNSNLGVHPAMMKDLVNPYWIVNCSNSEELARLRQSLNAHCVETRDWWSEGLHKHPAFFDLSADKKFPNCDQVISRSIALPFFEDLDEKSFEIISDAINFR